MTIRMSYLKRPLAVSNISLIRTRRVEATERFKKFPSSRFLLMLLDDMHMLDAAAPLLSSEHFVNNNNYQNSRSKDDTKTTMNDDHSLQSVQQQTINDQNKPMPIPMSSSSSSSSTVAAASSQQQRLIDQKNIINNNKNGVVNDGIGDKLMTMLHLLIVTIPTLLFIDGLRLFLFVLLLAPAFCVFVWYYCISSDRIVQYYSSHSWRNSCDIYGSCNNNNQRVTTTTTTTTTSTETTTTTTTVQKPVLLFFPGGAWLIGYKMWGALFAKAMSSHYLVIICDYRNYSVFGCGTATTTTVPFMVQDVHDAIVWTFHHCETYGGDSRRIILVGQSAGGHLCACVLLRKVLDRLLARQRQSLQSLKHDSEPTSHTTAASTTELDLDCPYSLPPQQQPVVVDLPASDLLLSEQRPPHDFDPTDLAGFVSLSAPFDLQVMKDTLARHGLGTGNYNNNNNTSGCCRRGCFGEQGLIDRMFAHQIENYDPQALLNQCWDLIQQEYRYQEQQQQQDEEKEEENGAVPVNLSERRETHDHHHHHLFVSHYLPPVAIFHGTGDKTVPYQGSENFYRTLAKLPQQVDGDEEEQSQSQQQQQRRYDSDETQKYHHNNKKNVQIHLYEGWSHTDPILEGLFDGDHRFHLDLHRLVQEWTTTTDGTTCTENAAAAITATTSTANIDNVDNRNSTDQENASLTIKNRELQGDASLDVALQGQRRLCPRCLIAAARFVNPF